MSTNCINIKLTSQNDPLQKARVTPETYKKISLAAKILIVIVIFVAL